MLSDVARTQLSTTTRSTQDGEPLFVKPWKQAIRGSPISCVAPDDDEPIIDTLEFSLEAATSEDDSSEDNIELLTQIISRSSNGAAAALFVMMGTLENSTHPKLLANAAKHFAFTRCAGANPFGIVDAQIAVVEGELLGSNTRTN